MVVNFEFLGSEPLDNVITCMHYKVDKVVFFGYSEMIQEYKDNTESFLQKYCGVKEVVFQSLPYDDLSSVLDLMRKEIKRELTQNNIIYFDITGGESLILVAFGMLSREYDTPMHQFDVINDKIIEFEENGNRKISQDGQAQKIELSLESYIELHGGKINNTMQKEIKGIKDLEYEKDVASIWQVAKENWQYWNAFSSFLREYMVPNSNLQVDEDAHKIINALRNTKFKINTPAQLNRILDGLERVGILKDVVHYNGKYKFRFKNKDIKDCIWDGGSILELHTYLNEKKINKECRIGVHIDWDGVIHEQLGIDVLNEIDVLSLNGNIVTFISCKTGKMGANQSLYALYELDTVAARFGGKYAKKVLVSAQQLGNVYRERAREMEIEVR